MPQRERRQRREEGGKGMGDAARTLVSNAQYSGGAKPLLAALRRRNTTKA